MEIVEPAIFTVGVNPVGIVTEGSFSIASRDNRTCSGVIVLVFIGAGNIISIS